MELRDSPTPPEPEDAGPEAVSEPDSEAVSQWPPRVPNPPPLPYAPTGGAELTLEESAIAPAEPDFTQARLDPARKEAADLRRSEGDSKVVVYDRKNPSGRTHGDTVLRPTDEERDARIRRRQRAAALQAAIAVAIISRVFVTDSWTLVAWFTPVGAAAGWGAFEFGDSEWSWTAAMFFAAVICTWQHGVLAMALTGGLFTACGWLMGFTRDASMSA